jgi:hypothetical protein
MLSQTTRDPRRPQLERWGGGWADDPAVVRSAASPASVLAIVCYGLRRKKFRFAHAVQAVQGGQLDLTYWQITSAEMPASRSLNASEYGNGSRRSARSRWLSSSAI